MLRSRRSGKACSRPCCGLAAASGAAGWALPRAGAPAAARECWAGGWESRGVHARRTSEPDEHLARVGAGHQVPETVDGVVDSIYQSLAPDDLALSQPRSDLGLKLRAKV